MADRAMRWRTVGEAMANRDRGDHAAADRDCKVPARVPGGENADFILRRIRLELRPFATKHHLVLNEGLGVLLGSPVKPRAI